MPYKPYLVTSRYVARELYRIVAEHAPQALEHACRGQKRGGDGVVARHWCTSVMERKGFPRPYYTEKQAAPLFLPATLFEKDRVDAFLRNVVEAEVKSGKSSIFVYKARRDRLDGRTE